MIIRPMTEEDTACVAEIESKSIAPPWNRQGFLDALAQETLMLVAEEEQRIFGYVVMYLSFEEGEITNVAVDPDFRGRGIADRLMEEAGTRSADRGIERIVLEVRKSNLPAIRLYEKHGFRELGIRKNFYEQPREDAVIMELRIC